MTMFYGDAMAFLGKRGGPLVVEEGLKLNLAHLTAVPPWVQTMEETLSEISKFREMIQGQPRLRLVLNQRDLAKAIADKKVAIVLGMQNLPKDAMVGVLFRAGIRIVSLAYYGMNQYGSGWLNAGIGIQNPWGLKILKDCLKIRMIIDLSHASHETARDVLILRKKCDWKLKVMASHGGCYSQYHHFRNLPDDVLKEVAEMGGIVGISTLTFTNDERDNSVFAFKKHLEHAIKLCGPDSVCVGSDDLYVTRTKEEAKAHFEVMSGKLDPLGTQGARFPENPLSIMGPSMLENLYKFSLPYFPVGVSEKIFGENLLKFFERTLPS